MTVGKDLPYATSLPPSPPHSPPGGSPDGIAHAHSVVRPHTPASTPDASMSLGTTNDTTRRTRSSDTSWLSRSSAKDVASKRGVPRLEDFELIRVVGKGCAGRVGGSHLISHTHLDPRVVVVVVAVVVVVVTPSR